MYHVTLSARSDFNRLMSKIRKFTVMRFAGRHEG
jgi:hypothetical protein